MYTKLTIAVLLILIVSCKKERTDQDKTKSVTELLTQKEWILVSHGFDDNNNNLVDDVENITKDCEKDNSYIFNIAGTGSVFDNALVCGGPVKSDFQWTLLSDTMVEIGFEKFSILQLNETELVFSPDLPWLTSKYILVYKH